MEGPNESLFANLETSEIRSEDAPSASNVHTEMTREGIPREEVMNLLRRRGINEDLVQALLGDFEQSGYVAQGPIDHRSEISEPEGGGQLATLLDDDKHSGHKKRLGKYLACLLLVGIMNILMSIVFLLTLPTPFTGNADTIALQMEGNDKEATTAAAETPLYLAAQKGDANMVDALPEEILEASRKALLPTSGDRPEELPQDGPNAVLPPPAAKHRKLFLARRNASVPPKARPTRSDALKRRRRRGDSRPVSKRRGINLLRFPDGSTQRAVVSGHCCVWMMAHSAHSKKGGSFSRQGSFSRHPLRWWASILE